ncbi:MAG: EF-P lysine aminoacylase GenX [Thioalkalivibrio sp.]|nr:MAG: EF-P lysine aminoacylase GenX [Thioalkalivibrio sp.]
MADWRPAAAPARPHRARLNALLREFMAARGVLEVETPVLSGGAPLDPGVESWRAQAPGGGAGYLQTSPEYPMKRLLAAGSGDIYQLARVFRGEEQGPRHNPEFSLLEWYRLDFDDRRLADEVVELVQAVAAGDPGWFRPRPEVCRVRYADLFLDAFGLDPLDCTARDCAAVAERTGLSIAGALDRDGWLDALMSLVLAPGFEPERLTLVHDYPESQAVLARPSAADPGYALRFELYWGDLELANGFHELTDPAIFVERRERDIERRRRNGQDMPDPDGLFAAAMHAGLPDCAGVALGVDRLLMRLIGAAHIDRVIDFPWGRA